MNSRAPSATMTATKRYYLDRLVRGDITIPVGNSTLMSMARAGWALQCGMGIDSGGRPTTTWRITDAGRVALAKATKP